jgi:WD40 repeat protein
MARVVFAPDGRHLFAVRDAGVQIEPGVADEILVYRLGAAAPVHTIPAFRSEGQARAVVGLELSPNGRFLIAVSDRGDVRLWDARGGS